MMLHKIHTSRAVYFAGERAHKFAQHPKVGGALIQCASQSADESVGALIVSALLYKRRPSPSIITTHQSTVSYQSHQSLSFSLLKMARYAGRSHFLHLFTSF